MARRFCTYRGNLGGRRWLGSRHKNSRQQSSVFFVSLTPVLRDLSRRGLIKRRQLASDRRSQTIELTPAGRSALRVLRATAARHERELARLVGKERKAEFLAVLRRIGMLLPVGRLR